MGLGAVVGLGSSLIGASSAKSAQKSQERAAQAQIDLQREVYDDTTQRFEPFYQQGQDYANALRFELLGGDRPSFGGNAASINEVVTPGAWTSQGVGAGRGERTEMVQGPSTTAYNVGGQSFADRAAAEAYAAQNTTGATPYGGYEMSDGYKFQLDQGQRAIDNSAASSGGLFSGATLKAQQQFGQGIAAQGYDNYLNRLTTGAASGQAAAGNQANAGANFAAGTGQAYANMGNAGAAGAIGVGNALQNGLSNGIGLFNYQNQQSATPSGGGSSANIFSAPWGSGGFWG